MARLSAHELRYGVLLLLSLALAGLTGCGRPQVRDAEDQPPPAPELQPAGAQAFEPVPEDSEIRVFVYRGGALASLGHNHVLAVERFDGILYLHEQLSRSGFELSFRLADMVLDRPADRAAAGEGFESELSEEDVAATRRNMLGKDGLDAENFPTVILRSVNITGDLPQPDVTVRVTLHGVSRDVTIPVRLDSNGTVTASGEFNLRQTDFGIMPYSAALGALRVRDEIRIRFRVVSKPRN